MSRIKPLLDEYGDSHQNGINKSIHWVCVPTIFWAIVALLYTIPNQLLIGLIGDSHLANWAVVSIVLSLIYYIYLSIPLSIGMLGFSTVCVYICQLLVTLTPIPLWGFALAAFVLAWIGQFYGHSIEGKKPTFLRDIQFLLIGPAWLMHFIYKKIGIKY